MDDLWQPYRERELETLSIKADQLAVDFALGRIPHEQLINGTAAIRRARERMAQVRWLPGRPGRRMPTLFAIAEYWHQRGTFEVDLDGPHCFGCQTVAEYTRDGHRRARWNSARLARAHLYDRFRGGLDGPQNIVPLCGRCHDVMPMFLAQGKLHPIDWVLARADEVERPRAS